ncbi:MAG: CHAP domain-containing protein [Clostridia bacterium]|nr:CHAP domain-containing protein [Clostridia bacterium]
MKRKRIAALALCVLLCMQPVFVFALSYTGSASYASGKYYTALSGVTLTGNMRTDVVAIAQSQIGYQEGSDSSQLSGEVMGGANYTEYGRWYGLQDMWCAMFVSWCAYNAGVPTSVVPKHSFTVSGLNQFISWGRAYTRAEVAAGTYTPRPGDIIYFKSSRNQNKTNHVGIVTGFSGSTIYTVEGNTSSATISTNGGAVCAKSYSTSNTYVVYVCCPNYTGEAVTPSTGVYFPACAQFCSTITEGLTSIGVDASYANRKVIAAANGLTDYSGTAEQNNQLLALLKAGRLIDPDGEPETPQAAYFPACADSYTTLAAALESVGADASYANRKLIAAANGIADYSGTAAQNTQLLDLLKAGQLIDPNGEPQPQSDCFPACADSYTTLAAALESVGADASFAYRKKIAQANGIENYSGTVDQNTQMLSLLKAGLLKKPADEAPTVTYFTKCDSSYTSLADALRSIGADSSYAYRKEIAAANGIAEYGGTAAQNTQLLDLLKAGMLIVPDTSSGNGACSCGSAYLEHVTMAETCTEDGAEYDRCTKCGTVSNYTAVPATGHAYVCTQTAATCAEPGAETYTCPCGESYMTALPPLGHDFDVQIAQNVTVSSGVKTVRCSRCAVCAVNKPGDSNADGAIDLKDVVTLRRALAAWDVDADALNADVNADNKLDLRDIILLERFVAGGWDVELRFAL